MAVIALGAVLVLRSRAPGDRAPASAVAGASSPAKAGPATPAAPWSATARARAAMPGAGTRVLEAAWGAGPGDLGRSVARESSPMAPMSFLPDASGRALVLDQVNHRVQVVEAGRVVRSIPLPSETFDDVARLGGDRVALLDRLVAGSVAVVDPSGKIEREIALVGEGIARAGDATSLHARDDGLWVEVDHDKLVRVADERGVAVASRSVVPGRFSADGRSWLSARVDADRAVTVTITPRDGSPATRGRVAFPLPVLSIAALESDPGGRVMLVAVTIEESPVAPYEVSRVDETLVVLDRGLAEQRRVALPPKSMPEEQLTRYRAGADGALYTLELDERGATLRRIDP